MVEKMLIYKTGNGDIPKKVEEAWQNFAVDYAEKTGLGTPNNPREWEVPNIVPRAFPSVGLLLYQWANEAGICGKIVVQPGYNDIMEMQERLGDLPGCVPTDYRHGMAGILHRHPKLVFHRNRFVGPVVDEAYDGRNTVYRVREHYPENGKVSSIIYVDVPFDRRTEDLFKGPTGISAVVLHTREADIDLSTKKVSGYPENITRRSLKSYLEEIGNPAELSGLSLHEFCTLRIGKQEIFTGLSETPLLLGLEGADNLKDYGLTVPSSLADNIGPEYRNLIELKQGSVSSRVNSWHWVITGEETAAAGEISGMPHIDERGSIDAGDIFYSKNAVTEDPLYLRFMRTRELEGH